jgi:hypothetical protein
MRPCDHPHNLISGFTSETPLLLLMLMRDERWIWPSFHLLLLCKTMMSKDDALDYWYAVRP